MKKKILPLLCVLAMLLSGCGQQVPERETDRLQVVTTIFAAYDFARAAAGEQADVAMLLPPGMESHSYEPTPADILAVQECDLFIYLGGESDTWVETILSSIEMRGKALRMVDCVELLEEEHVEGMQMQPGHDHESGEAHDDAHDHDHDHDHHDHDHHDNEETNLGTVVGMDEHVWTSPKNAARITETIGAQLTQLDSAHAAEYERNAAAYSSQILELDEQFAAFFDAQPSRTIVFGDRFPLRYFAEEFQLDYYAAFPGCGTQTEPSAATVAFLTEKVRAEQIPTIWYIEFSNHLVADSIAEATKTRTAMFHTCHNVSGEEIESGATYCTLMQKNLETLQAYF